MFPSDERLSRGSNWPQALVAAFCQTASRSRTWQKVALDVAEPQMFQIHSVFKKSSGKNTARSAYAMCPGRWASVLLLSVSECARCIYHLRFLGSVR
eukprot:6202491-Pleurochrysis_carterae.AAC.1